MKYIKNGTIQLDGTIRECDLEEKLLKALEIIIDKKVNVSLLQYYKNPKRYNQLFEPLTQQEFDLIKEIMK